MPSWKVMDEAIINAAPSAVFRALVDEYSGRSSWWKPFLEAKLRGGGKALQGGSTFDIHVRYRGKARFTGEITEIVECRLIRVAYTGGDFLGEGEWTLRPSDGKTKLNFLWSVRSDRFLLTLISPFVDVGKNHSEVVRLGFMGLNDHLSRTDPV